MAKSRELEPNSRVYARYFASLSHRELRRRRGAGEHVSGAHSEPHLNGVAEQVPAIGKAYDFPVKVILLGRFAAQFHDIERSEREDLGDEDERRSAERAVATLGELHTNGVFPTSDEERGAVAYAIRNHGTPPSFFRDQARREETPQELNEQVHVMLYVADGLQKLGAPLINRRSAFVGGERRTTGDLQGMQYEGQSIDAVHAILLESGVRLGWKGTEGVYPQRLAEFIAPAFAVQRDWVSGLLAGRDWDMAGWAYALWNTRNERGQNFLELSKLPNLPQSVEEIKRILEEVGKMGDERIRLAAADPDLVLSSMEAADYFSAHHADESRGAIAAWNPQGERAKLWKKDM